VKVRKVWIAVAVGVPLAILVTAVVAYLLGGRDALRTSEQENDYLVGFREYEQCSLTLNYLGLSESQAKGYRAIGRAADPELSALRKQIRERKTDLLRLLCEGGSDTAAIAEVFSETASLQSALERKTVDYIMRLRAVLTDSQVAKYDRMMECAVCPWL
jgi:Spy/CpxP family protein refolding chaperone